MSKRSREKHARVEFVPLDDDSKPSEEQDEMCTTCGCCEKLPGRDICAACAGDEYDGRL
jgi:hypothetical protein